MKISKPRNWTVILGVRIFSRNREYILEKVKKYLSGRRQTDKKGVEKPVRPMTIFTPNPEIIVFARSDGQFRKILNLADVTLPDGIGVVLASRFLGRQKSKFKNQKSLKRISGVDFMKDLCQMSPKMRLTIGLIGGRDGVALTSLKCLQSRYRGLHGWASDGPEIEITEIRNKFLSAGRHGKIQSSNVQNKRLQLHGDSWESVINTIVSRQTDILFVAFGHPKQEYFIDMIKKRLVQRGYARPIVFMAVGGAFDVLSGRISRAPKWIRRYGFEWFYRFIREPSRFKRQMALIWFAALVVREYRGVRTQSCRAQIS